MTSAQILWIAIPAISCILYAALFLLRRHDIGAVGSWFSAFLLAAAWWSLCSMILHADPGWLEPVWVMRLMLFGSMAIPLCIFGFVVHFLSLRQGLSWLYFGVVFYLIVMTVNLNGGIVREAHVDRGLVESTYGSGFVLAGVYWSLFIYAAAFLLVRELGRTTDQALRNRLRYNLVVLSLLWLGNALNGTPLNAYPADLLAAALAAVFISVSLSRYQVLAAGRSIQRIMVLGIFVVLYVAVVFSAFYITAQVQSRLVAPVSLAAALLTAVVLFSFPAVRRGLMGFVDRVFFPKRYDTETLIYTISSLNNRLRPPAEMARRGLEEIERALRCRSAAILLGHVNEAGHGPGEGPELRTLAAVRLPPEADAVRFRADSPLVRELTSSSRAAHVDTLRDLPRMRSLWIEEWDALQRLDAEVLAPMLVAGAFLGFIVLGPKQGSEPYFEHELGTVLPTLANQLATALENSYLYAQTQARADELAQANEDLRALDRVKNELIQNVSHELRTPVSIIQAYAELLGEEMSSDHDREILSVVEQEAASAIMAQTQRLSHLVQDILTITQLEGDRRVFTPVDLDGLAREAVRQFQVVAPAGIKLRIVSPRTPGEPPLPLVMGLPDRLLQVFNNLLSNAIKFSPEGGEITVSLHCQANMVVAEVADHGIGIAAADQPRIWDRFYQADRSLARKFGGMGLGLSIVQKIVDLHGGWVDVISEAGAGSVFRFALPVAGTAVEAPQDSVL